MHNGDVKENSNYVGMNSQTQHILLLGSGFAGIEVLKKLQKRFQK